ncbi:MAG: hypothetical protein IAC55_03075 [Tyzzerella sp.]|uniref:Conjugal transfer protein TrbL n=1 Tax=Candidatus Fimicola merdigallinarum TaxID=2840819 RepID=A0A9D9DY19_9FIRM|nr:hypothetical protein [Candidatus Fimicola merdigallinarum]
MFGMDLAVDGVLDQFCDWIYGKLISFFGDFFSMINLMGAELFELNWIKGILLFFNYFAWALYVVGIVVAVFDTAIEAQRGKGSLQDVGLNIIKGFFAVSLFTIVPIDLYIFCINLSNGLIGAIAGMTESEGKLGAIATMILGGFETPASNIVVAIVFVILIGYAVIKVFFANLKRGGILLTMMATGSLYMFSVPRGYTDGFISWCKQVIALCLTAFLQTIVLIAGLVTYNTNMLLGIGLMLSSTEVPRIAQNFGLDTSMRFNVMSTVYSVNSVVNMTRNIGRMVSK